MDPPDIESAHRSPLPWRVQRRIQRLNECEHFHYPFVEIGPVQIKVNSVKRLPLEAVTKVDFSIFSNGKIWTIVRDLVDIIKFDSQLHRCVFERRYSKLEELELTNEMDLSTVEDVLLRYTSRLSQLTGSLITCYPVLKFLEIDCRGNRFEPAEETAVNVPAVAAAVVTKDFQPQDLTQLRLRVGDILSIIEMNPVAPNTTTYWKAKLTIAANKRESRDLDTRGVEVGYFPSDCVRLIDDKRLPSPLSSHRKSTIKTARRMTELLRNRVRRREPIFGMDLTEHLDKSGRNIPLILERCCEAIEKLGVVTGIYRQCGIQSNIQRLRAKFDHGNEPDLFDFGQRDIYSVSSLLKQYFRQLPNPLFPYEAYSSIVTAYEVPEDQRDEKLKLVLLSLPSSHYRTANYLLRHLHRLCEFTHLTDMTSKNLAIVWAPNLFRAPPTINGAAESHLLSGLNIHTALCNHLITKVEELFDETSGQRSSLIIQDGTIALVDKSKEFSWESINPLITKSATVSDMRTETESKWPRFLRGRSVEGFWKFGRRSTVNGAMSSSISQEPVKWRRSHSTDASLHNSRTPSIISFVSRGMEELRGGVRNLRERARSLRPTSRPPPSPSARYRHYSQAPPSPSSRKRDENKNDQWMHDSITVSTTSHYSEDSTPPVKSFLTPQIIRRESATEKSSSSDVPKVTFEPKERRVMFKQDEITDEVDEDSDTNDIFISRPLYERSSPVEEWSSDSRDSTHLEISRYDNVSPSGTLTRRLFEQDNLISLAKRDLPSRIAASSSLFDRRADKPFFLT